MHTVSLSMENNKNIKIFGYIYNETAHEILVFISDVILRYFLPRALAAPLFGGSKSTVQLARGHNEEHFFEMILNLDRWFWKKCCLKIFLI